MEQRAIVKTTVSIQRSLFDEADTIAQELHVPRSRLYALAIESFIQRYRSQQLLEGLNAAHASDLETEAHAFLNAVDQHLQDHGPVQFGDHEHHRQGHAHTVQDDVGRGDPEEMGCPSWSGRAPRVNPSMPCPSVCRRPLRVADPATRRATIRPRSTLLGDVPWT
jgi:predicted transcriptional regulator